MIFAKFFGESAGKVTFGNNFFGAEGGFGGVDGFICENFGGASWNAEADGIGTDGASDGGGVEGGHGVVILNNIMSAARAR